MRLLSGLTVFLALALAACSSTPEEIAEAAGEAAPGQEIAAASEPSAPANPVEADVTVNEPWLGRLGLLTWGEGSPAAPQVYIIQSAEEFLALEGRIGVALGEPPEAGQHVTVVFLGALPQPTDFVFLRRNAVKGDTRTLVLRHTPADPDEDEGVRAQSPWAVIRHRGPVFSHTEVQFETTVDGAVVRMPERTLRVRTVPLASPEPAEDPAAGENTPAAP